MKGKKGSGGGQGSGHFPQSAGKKPTWGRSGNSQRYPCKSRPVQGHNTGYCIRWTCTHTSRHAKSQSRAEIVARISLLPRSFITCISTVGPHRLEKTVSSLD